MAVILSPKAWPDSSASGALAFAIASHLYIGSRLAQITSTASALQQGDSRADWVALFACSTACSIHGSHSHERLFMRDVRQRWLDVTRLLFHYRRTSVKEVEDVLIHNRGFTKGCPCRSTDGSPTSPN